MTTSTKKISRKKSKDSNGKGPTARWTERVDASVSPDMKERMDKESMESGLSAAGIVRIALRKFFEEKDGEATI